MSGAGPTSWDAAVTACPALLCPPARDKRQDRHRQQRKARVGSLKVRQLVMCLSRFYLDKVDAAWAISVLVITAAYKGEQTICG